MLVSIYLFDKIICLLNHHITLYLSRTSRNNQKKGVADLNASLKIPETFSPVLDKSRWYFKHCEPVLNKILASVFVDNFQWNNLKKRNWDFSWNSKLQKCILKLTASISGCEKLEIIGSLKVLQFTLNYIFFSTSNRYENRIRSLKLKI